MTNLSDDQYTRLLRQVIREEMRPIIQEEVGPIIREEVADIRQDVALIKNVQSQQAMQFREVTSTLISIKSTLRVHSREIRRLAAKVEDLDDRFKTAAEIS
ncbi:MAG TPA: hypothetical protein VG992_03985 [Candidatus Saccharimonadales bacterium]|nr:hypothetical protein [Candidatus Saccharimonadales bacterium]